MIQLSPIITILVPAFVLMGLPALGAEPTAPKTAPVLEMRMVADAKGADTEEMVIVGKDNDPNTWEVVHVQKKALLDASSVKTAFVAVENNRPIIQLEFNEAGSVQFAEVTREAKGKRLAIVIDGALYTAPRIMTSITGGKANVSGAFSQDEAKRLAEKINAAAKK